MGKRRQNTHAIFSRVEQNSSISYHSLVVFHLLQLTPTRDPNQEITGMSNETCTALKARVFVV
jgi:hypothetical protein